MNKKEWLDYLYYKVGKQNFDFFICGLKLLPDGNVFATKWKRYSEVCFPLNPWESDRIDWVNQRQIFPNELVLDIEEPEKLNPIIDRLKIENIPFECYSTGSRGFHIHLIFKKELDKTEKLFYIKEFGVDEQKAYSKTMIALENCPHWKTGKLKTKLTGEQIEIINKKFQKQMGFVLNKKPKEITEEQAVKEWREKNGRN